MNPQQTQSFRGRSVLAVGGGLVLIAAASHGTDALLRALDVFPAFGEHMSSSMFAAAAVYRTLYGIVGCYLAARLAPRRPQLHALILGGIGTVLSSLGVIAVLQQEADLGPLWYALSLVMTALPSAWLGGRLSERHTLRAQAAT